MFYKKAVLKKFCYTHKKTPVLESLFNKAADLKTCNFKRDSNKGFFSVNIVKFFKISILKSICERLLLHFSIQFVIFKQLNHCLKQ